MCISSFKGPGDPVHSQLIYITPGLLWCFFKQYHILPYTIRQYPGEAVFIPAYCAHQIANLVDAIKITSDFISITNIQRTQHLIDEFREQHLSSSGDDVLQFYLTLWYAWANLSHLAKTFSQEDTSHFSFQEVDHLAGSSVYFTSSSTAAITINNFSLMSIDSLPITMEFNSGRNGDHGMASSGGSSNTMWSERGQALAKERKKAQREADKFVDHQPKAKAWACPAKGCKHTFD